MFERLLSENAYALRYRFFRGFVNARKIKIITVSGKVFCPSAGPSGAY
jgi:hypothetical protein